MVGIFRKIVSESINPIGTCQLRSIYPTYTWINFVPLRGKDSRRRKKKVGEWWRIKHREKKRSLGVKPGVSKAMGFWGQHILMRSSESSQGAAAKMVRVWNKCWSFMSFFVKLSLSFFAHLMGFIWLLIGVFDLDSSLHRLNMKPENL